MAFPFRKACRLRNVLFSCSAPPGHDLLGLAFTVLASFHVVGRVASIRGVSGESSGRLFGRLVLPDARAVRARLPGLPGSCHSELLPPSPSGQAATTVALVLHALGQPGFP